MMMRVIALLNCLMLCALESYGRARTESDTRLGILSQSDAGCVT